MRNYLNRKMLQMSSALTVGMLAGSESALAEGESFNKVGGNIITGIASIPGLITGLAYMLGILLAVLGILKIKDHVENPGQTPLQHGIIRLAAGGALFAVPIITEAMENLLDPASQTGAVTSKVKKVEYLIR